MGHEHMAVLASVAKNTGYRMGFCGRANTLARKRFKGGVSADGTLGGWNNHVLLHISSPKVGRRKRTAKCGRMRNPANLLPQMITEVWGLSIIIDYKSISRIDPRMIGQCGPSAGHWNGVACDMWSGC